MSDFGLHEYMGKYVPVEHFINACKNKKPIQVEFKDIDFKGLTKIYEYADEKIPGILAEGISDHKIYRMCDGRHRLTKMIKQKKTYSEFYILSKSEFNRCVSKRASFETFAKLAGGLDE